MADVLKADPVPTGNTKDRATFYLKGATRDKLSELSEKHDASLSSIVTQLIDFAHKKMEK